MFRGNPVDKGVLLFEMNNRLQRGKSHWFTMFPARSPRGLGPFIHKREPPSRVPRDFDAQLPVADEREHRLEHVDYRTFQCCRLVHHAAGNGGLRPAQTRFVVRVSNSAVP
jgi:hypothetical protein